MLDSIFPSTLLGHLLTTTAVIQSIPDGTDETARTTVIASLASSLPQALSAEDKERAGLAATARVMRAFSAVPSVSITERHRYIVGSTDYRIRAITAVPDESPRFYEYLIEDEGVASNV